MLISKQRHNRLQKDYDDLWSDHVNKIDVANRKIDEANAIIRKLNSQLDLERNLRRQAEAAKQEAKKRYEIAREAFRTLHRVYTQFRANPNRTDFLYNEIQEVEEVAKSMDQSMKEWL